MVTVILELTLCVETARAQIKWPQFVMDLK